jgi:hypothetical protein
VFVSSYSVVVTNLLTDLNALAEIPDGWKLNAGPHGGPHSYANPRSVYDWLRRKVLRQDATSTMIFVRQTCVQITQEISNYQATAIYAKLIEKMRRAKGGIEKLIKVYEEDEDPFTVSHLYDSAHLLDLLDRQIDGISHDAIATRGSNP